MDGTHGDLACGHGHLRQELGHIGQKAFERRGGAYSTDSCHPIHGKVATQSTGSLPPSPRETCHSVHGKVATHSRRSLPPSERSDAGWHIISLNWLFLSTGPAVCAWILLVMEFCMRCGPDDRGWHRRASDLQGPHASARRGVGS